MIKNIILASRSGIRKKILENNGIKCEVIPARINEDQIKGLLLKTNTTPELISKNLAELKANKISKKKYGELVLGADSVIDLNGELISKPTNREEAFKTLRKLNGQKHQLISSVCISKNGSMIWNSTDASTLTMKRLNPDEIKSYLVKIEDKELYAYGVYQIEAGGRFLFSKIEGDEDSIMGLPTKQIKKYLNTLELK
jgi:septum formation protein